MANAATVVQTESDFRPTWKRRGRGSAFLASLDADLRNAGKVRFDLNAKPGEAP